MLEDYLEFRKKHPSELLFFYSILGTIFHFYHAFNNNLALAFICSLLFYFLSDFIFKFAKKITKQIVFNAIYMGMIAGFMCVGVNTINEVEFAVSVFFRVLILSIWFD